MVPNKHLEALVSGADEVGEESGERKKPFYFNGVWEAICRSAVLV